MSPNRVVRTGCVRAAASTIAADGGAFQHLIHSIDPKHHLDAIAPEITWHDLDYSCYTGDAQPFRGYDCLREALASATALLQTGDELRLQIYASYPSRYRGSGSRQPEPVRISWRVGLPPLPPDLLQTANQE